jgi:hypothetical protein
LFKRPAKKKACCEQQAFRLYQIIPRLFTNRISTYATTMLCVKIVSFIYASPFFFTVLRGLTGASAAAAVVAASTGFFVVDLFNLDLIALLFLDTPKEPLKILPFFDFLSPLPMLV